MANENKIWSYLKAKGMSDFATAGIMGNLQAESGLNPQNLQNSYEKKLGFTDASYTEAVDKGTYGNFIKDSAGYGLAQWTYWTRKQALLDLAKQQKKSIGDLDMQLDYLYKELTGYKLIAPLNAANSVKEASNIILLQFERPADQSQAVQDKRASYGEKWYKQFAGTPASIQPQAPAPAPATKKGGNSSLVTVTKYSPNHSGKRTHAIDRITPHCFVGQVNVDRGLEVFLSTSRQASCNYVIAYDGQVGLCVDEENRSWCSSSSANDQRAVTIEVASDSTAPYAFKEAAYSKLIDLCVDICRRNGKNVLLWIDNKEKALAYEPKANEMLLTVHRWFANKSCPGDWMYARMGELAAAVTKKLGGSTVQPVTPTPEPTAPVAEYQVGDIIKLIPGSTYWDGKAIPDWIFNSTLYYRGKNENGIIFSTQKTGAVTGIVKSESIQGNSKPTESTTPAYSVKVTADALNYRSGPGANYPINGTIKDHGVYTIVQTVGNWGKLKSGAGWICLDYTKRN